MHILHCILLTTLLCWPTNASRPSSERHWLFCCMIDSHCRLVPPTVGSRVGLHHRPKECLWFTCMFEKWILFHGRINFYLALTKFQGAIVIPPSSALLLCVVVRRQKFKPCRRVMLSLWQLLLLLFFWLFFFSNGPGATVYDTHKDKGLGSPARSGQILCCRLAKATDRKWIWRGLGFYCLSPKDRIPTWRQRDSNPRPQDQEPIALPTEPSVGSETLNYCHSR